MRRLFPALVLIPLLCLLAAPRPALAGAVTGGALNGPGEKSHNIAIGWPEIFYTWEGLSREKHALGIRVGLQIWPLAFNLGLNARFTIKEEGRVALALLVVPSFNFAGFGGTRSSWPKNYDFGRWRTFRASLGPGVNLGLLVSVDVSPVTHLLFTLENPLVLWIWTAPAEWWFEWPILLSAGVEYEVNYSTSLFGRLGAGPSVAFAGDGQGLGYHWHAHFGVQVRY
jgi:hypothetical protein